MAQVVAQKIWVCYAIGQTFRGCCSATSEQLWSCPMHPEILSGESGRCPICGMELEERVASAEEHQRLHGGSNQSAAQQESAAQEAGP